MVISMTHMVVSACGVAEALYGVGHNCVLGLTEPHRRSVWVGFLKQLKSQNVNCYKLHTQEMYHGNAFHKKQYNNKIIHNK